MSEYQLNPKVREFKDFIKKYPKLIEEVRRNGRHWQEYYEKWILLGEDDPMWEQYKERKPEEKKETGTGKMELVGQLMRLTQNLDMEKVQTHVEQLSTALATVQEMLGHMQTDKTTSSSELNRPDPFNLFRD